MADTDEDTNQDGKVDVFDCQYVPPKQQPEPGSLTITVRDAKTMALLSGVTVTLEGSPLTGQTSTAGVLTLSPLDAGLYGVTVTGAGLALSGSAIVASGTVSASAADVPVLAGKDSPLSLGLDRIPATLNLKAIKKGGSPTFTAANCVACHTDRKNETSLDPAIKPFHAIGAHSALSCTTCHTSVDLQANVDPVLRDQVDSTKTCKMCHTKYPKILPL
ncbi:MAG: hypothetical protein AMXMBFR64_56870 [Myxococcales bacterium]